MTSSRSPVTGVKHRNRIQQDITLVAGTWLSVPMRMIPIGLHQEYVLRIGSFLVSNSLFTALIVSALILVGAFFGRYAIGNGEVFAKGPSVSSLKNRIQYFGEMLLEPIWKFVLDVLEHEKVAIAVFPYIATFFIFIFIGNFVEILPGFLGSFGVEHASPAIASGEGGRVGMIPLLRSPSTDLNTTLALALISVGITQVFAIKFLGFKKFISKFINVRSPVKAFLGLFEAVGEISKILSFSFRLFGNMFAGSVLLIVIGFLVPYLIPLPFLFLELFVGLVQAVIFSILTLMFIKAALAH